MCVHLPFDHRKATQALNFFAVKNGGHINKMRSIKLIYFADRYHLRRYGRPITNDEYFAMSYGPVNSGVKDIAEMSGFLGAKELDYASKFVAPSGYDVQSILPVDWDVFSQSDTEALSFAWERFSQYNEFQLAEITHQYPEWKRFEETLKDQSRVRMNYEDFLNDPAAGFEDCCPLTAEEKADRLDQIKEAAALNALWS